MRRIKSPRHLKFVRERGCLICGGEADAHHVKTAQLRGVGLKVSDEYCVPLCRAHHMELHHIGNEDIYWASQGIDPLHEAAILWQQSGGGGEEDDPAGSDLPALGPGTNESPSSRLKGPKPAKARRKNSFNRQKRQAPPASLPNED